MVLLPTECGALEAKDLVGKWQGQLIVTGRDRETKETLKMEFQADGKVLITTAGSPVETVPFAVKDGVLFFKKMKNQEPEVKLDRATLTDTALKGVLVPATGKRTRWKIEIALQRK